MVAKAPAKRSRGEEARGEEGRAEEEAGGEEDDGDEEAGGEEEARGCVRTTAMRSRFGDWGRAREGGGAGRRAKKNCGDGRSREN